MKRGKKILCMLLAALLLIGCLPMGAIPVFAKNETSGSCGENTTWNYDETTKTLTVSGTGEMSDFDKYYFVPWESYRKEIEVVLVQPGLTYIGKNAFRQSVSLRSVSISDSVKKIGNSAFCSCSALTSMTIPDSVTSIDNGAFDGCENLNSVILPNSVTSIGVCAFSNCTNLISVSLPNSITDIAWGLFMGCKSLPSIAIPDSVTTIGDHAFSGCGSLKSVVIPDKVKRVGSYAFCNCADLNSVTIPDGVAVIDDDAFANCTSLTSLYIPSSVIDLGDWSTFLNCDGLTLYGETGSYAERYAKAWGIRFVSTSSPDPIDPDPDPIDPDPDPDPVDPDPVGTRFQDVDGKAYYAEAVKWAVEKGITSGTDKNHFSPNAFCTRAQAVAFLWRAAGEPEPQGTAAGFTDVKAGAYYEKAVQWAVEQGITAGTGVGKFSPEVPCTRGQIVAFLWRKEGTPEAAGAAFGDVQPGAYYETAVKWAVEQGITAGTSATTFSPESRCTRAQIVSFLYRYQG